MSVAAASMKRDLAAAYAASAARVVAWLIVSALVCRTLGIAAFALLVLVRSTIGLLNYTSLGLGPAMISLWPKYAVSVADDATQVILGSALKLAAILGLAGAGAVAIYTLGFTSLHRVPVNGVEIGGFVLTFGLGMVARLVGDAPGAALQIGRRIALDNLVLAGGELLWAGLSAAAVCLPQPSLGLIGAAYLLSGLAQTAVRLRACAVAVRPLAAMWAAANGKTIRTLLGAGSLITLAQLADFLYAPLNVILINRMISAEAVAGYAAAIQIDAALLLLVSALSVVLLPSAALAHATADRSALRAYYIKGTLASIALLLAGALVAYLSSPVLFRLWLDNEMRASQAILPLVLVHTVLGGASGVGRAVLLGMGRTGAVSVSALLGGVTNVALAVLFVLAGMGLRGVVLATIVSVTARCAVWMPWYVARVLRQATPEATSSAALTPTAPRLAQTIS